MCINWFYQNRMKANSSKFQSIVLGNVLTDDMINFSFNVGNANLPLSDNVKLLGVNIDNKFHENIITKENNLRDRSVRAIQTNVRTIKYGLNSFRYNGAKIWNLLPINNKCTATYKHFKYLICNGDGHECACGACILCV